MLASNDAESQDITDGLTPKNDINYGRKDIIIQDS